MSAQLSLGLDVGSTNSAASILNGELIEPSIPGSGAQLMSCIYWCEGKDPILGLPALRASYKDPSRLSTHVKRRLFDSPNEAAYCGHSAVECTGLIIRELVKVAKKAEPEIGKCLDGDQAARSRLTVVLSAPATWGTTQQDSLRQAAAIAGLEVDAILPEPVVAARRVLQEKCYRIQNGDLLAVFDFGGGTTDLSTLRYANARLDTVVAARGDEYLGGDIITGYLFRHFCDQLRLKLHDAFDDQHGLQLQRLDNEAKARQALNVWLLANDAKEQLSTSDNATVFFDARKTPTEISLTRKEYLSVTAPLWDRFEEAISGMLEGSSLDFSDVTHFVLVGGSAMAFGARESVSKITGRPVEEILISTKSTHVVASGCALAGAYPDHGTRHLPRGLGIRIRAGGDASSYINKMFLATGHIFPEKGETIEDLGQFLRVDSASCQFSIQFVEAAPGVVVPEPTPGVPSLLDDREVRRLKRLSATLEDLPAGEHEVRVGFSVGPDGATHYHIVPIVAGCEGLHGTLEAEHSDEESELSSESGEYDIFVLLDVSGSMRKQRKLEYAKRAVRSIFPQLEGKNLHVGLIAFGEEVTVLAGLQASRRKLSEALEEASPRGGTPLAEALTCATQEFERSDPQNKRVVILTTDGRPADATRAEEAARDLRKKATLFCIGIGSDVDGGLLQRIATTPQDYWHAQSADQVPLLFGQIVELFLNDDSDDDA